MESDWEWEYDIHYTDCHEEQRRLYTAAVTIITIPCRILTPLSRRSLVFFTDSLMTQRSTITPADPVHCCHGAHRFILQTLCPSWHGGHRCLLHSFFFFASEFTGVFCRTNTSLAPLSLTSLTASLAAFIWISCKHFATRPVAGDACRFLTRLPQTRQSPLQIRCNAPNCSSVSPADILLQQLSLVLPAYLFKLLP